MNRNSTRNQELFTPMRIPNTRIRGRDLPEPNIVRAMVAQPG